MTLFSLVINAEANGYELL